MFLAPWPLRRRERSSRNVTSRTRCREFSIAQWARAAVISFSPSATAHWPMLTRAPVPKAVTTCRAERPAARSNERRKVLPSIASTPSPSAPRSSRKAAKARPKASGSSIRNTREKVSWLDKPLSRRRNSCSSGWRNRAKPAKSTQVSAPQTEATSAMVRISSNSCRRALPHRGSGISCKIFASDAID